MADTPSVNVMAGLKFTLLGTELYAGIEQTSKGQHIFIFQDITTHNEGVTIAKLISDVKALMGTPDKEVPGLSEDVIKDKLNKVAEKGSTFDINSVRIVLNTVFLDIVKHPDGTSEVEYAFRLDVIAKDLINPDIKIINIDRITLAVWNTENPKIKKQLAISIESAK